MLENMDKIILTTREELKEIILEVLQEHFRPKEEIQETLTLDQALEVLKDNGYPTSKAQVYRLTSSGEIPYGKYGNKLVFSRKELLQWASSQVINMNDNFDSILALVKSAKKQQKG